MTDYIDELITVFHGGEVSPENWTDEQMQTAADAVLSRGNLTEFEERIISRNGNSDDLLDAVRAKVGVPGALDHSEDWLPEKLVKQCASRGEVGHAELLAKLFKNRIIFDHTERAWHIWNGQNWERDKRNLVINLVSNQLAAQYAHVGTGMLKQAQNDKDDQKRAFEFLAIASSLSFRNKINNVLALAQSQPDLSLVGDEWDSNPMLLGVQNGVVDLKTGKHRPGYPTDYLRKVASVEFEGLDVIAPRFTQFLNEIFGDDSDVVDFMQRLLGYGITGKTTDHILPVLWGQDGRNGKGILLRVLKMVLGDFAAPVKDEVLLSSKMSPNAASPHIMQLRGLRLAYVNETEEGQRLTGGQVKQLTGGDRLVGRDLYSGLIEFEPTHKILLITNHLPHINSDDLAIWERVLLIPFTQRFLDNPMEDSNEHLRDPHLSEKLEKEKSGILAWLIGGCLEWQRVGLLAPESVKAATEEYRQEEDTLSEFLDECCVIDDDAKVKASEFYNAYAGWSTSKPMSSTSFGRRMVKRFERPRRADGKYYIGVRVKSQNPYDNLD